MPLAVKRASAPRRLWQQHPDSHSSAGGASTRGESQAPPRSLLGAADAAHAASALGEGRGGAEYLAFKAAARAQEREAQGKEQEASVLSREQRVRRSARQGAPRRRPSCPPLTRSLPHLCARAAPRRAARHHNAPTHPTHAPLPYHSLSRPAPSL